MTRRKTPSELTTEGVLRRLFPQPVRTEVRRVGRLYRKEKPMTESSETRKTVILDQAAKLRKMADDLEFYADVKNDDLIRAVGVELVQLGGEVRDG